MATDYKGWTPPPGAVVEPPVHVRTLVLGMYSNGITDDEPSEAGDLNWSSYGDGPRVVAYAVVREYVEPKVAREWWLTDNGCWWTTYEAAKEAYGDPDDQIIHVREVLPADPSREVVAWALVNGAETPAEAAAEIARLRAKVDAAEKLAEAAWGHEEAFSVLEDSYQIAARDALIAALSAYEGEKG